MATLKSSYRDQILFMAPLDEILNKSSSTGHAMVFRLLSEFYDVVALPGSDAINKKHYIPIPLKLNHQTYEEKISALKDYFSTHSWKKYKYVFLSYSHPLLIPILKEFLHPNVQLYIWYHNTIYYPNHLIYAELNYYYSKMYNIRIVTASPKDTHDLRTRLHWVINPEDVLPPYLGTEDFNKYFIKNVDPEYDYRLVFIGRMSADNYILEMIDMVNSMSKEFTLDLYGPNYLDDTFYQKLVSLCKDNPRIRYLGPLDHKDIPKVITKYKCMIGRLVDSFGLSTYEASRLGLTLAAPVQDNMSSLYLYGNPQTNIIQYKVKDNDDFTSMYKNLGKAIEKKWNLIDKAKNLKVANQFGFNLFEQRLQKIIEH